MHFFNNKWKSALLVAVSLFGVAAFAAASRAVLDDTPATGEGTTDTPSDSTAVADSVVVDEPVVEAKSVEFATIALVDFEDESTYTKGWTIGSKTTAYYGTRTVGDTTSHFMNLKNTGSGNDANTYTLSNKMFLEAEKWALDFDFAGYNSNSKTVYFEVQQSAGTLLKVTFDATWSAPASVTDGAGNKLGTINLNLQDKSTRGNEIAVTEWYHVSLIDEGEGVYATITAADGTEAIAKVKIAESGVHPTGFNLQQGNALSQWAIDDITLAIAKDWVAATTVDFEDEATYTKGWTIGSKTTAYYGTRTVGDTTSHFMNLKNTGSGNDANTYTLSNKMFLEAEKWALDFDFAGYNSNSKTVYFEVQQSAGTLLKVTFDATWTAPASITDGAGNKLGTINLNLQDKNTRGQEIAVTEWYHVSLIDEGEGVYATITAADGTEAIAKVKIAESGVHPTGFNLQQGNALSQWAIDDIVASFFGAGEVVDIPTISASGETYEANTITIDGNSETTIYYTLTENDVTSEAIQYTEPFIVKSSVTVTAWAESVNGNLSEKDALSVVAGKIVTPTATVTGVAGNSRAVTLATTTPDASITYFLNGAAEGVAYSEPFTISDSTLVQAVATRGEFVSDTLKTTIGAGTLIQLAGVSFAVAAVADSALAAEYEANNLKDIILTADQSSVLCTPTAQITYTYIPWNDGLETAKAVTATVNSGDTIKGFGIGVIKAVAVNADYATSAEASMWIKAPSVLTKERVNNFSRAAWGDHTSDLTVAISATVETIKGTTYGTVTIDGKTAYTDEEGNVLNDATTEGFLVQTATNWLKRGGYDGFYQFNSGGRCVAVQNLEAGNIVKIYGHSGSEAFEFTLVDNGVAEADVTATTANSIYTYNIVSRGTLALNMHRYGYIDSIIVYSDPNAPKTPTFTVESANMNTRVVSIASAGAKVGQEIYYATGKLAADSTIEWSDDVLYEAPIEVSSEAPYLRAYAFYMGTKSAENEQLIETNVVTLNQPVIKFIEATEAGRKFEITVDNSSVIDANPQGIYYTLPGGELTAYTEPIVVANDVYGWLTAISQVEGCEASKAAARYLDARETYNETYEAVTAETDALPAEAADLEIADPASLNASQSASLKATGQIYFHKTMHAGYNAVVVPFNLTTANLTSGAVKVTDETGKSLERGTDYTLYRIQASTDFTTIASQLAEGTLLHTANIVGPAQSYLIKVSEDLVDKDIIFVSATNTSLSVNKWTEPSLSAEGKWQVVNNKTFAPIVMNVPFYVVDEVGESLKRFDAGSTLAPYDIAVIADSATSVSTLFIPLVAGATAIESIQTELQEAGVIFDMMGRRVLDPKAGKVYIMNGKKFIQR